MITSLLHHSDIGSRRRHTAIAAAGLPSPAAIQDARGMVPERVRGSLEVAFRHRHGVGLAVTLNSRASDGALRREVDDVVPAKALRLPHGHFNDPLDLHVSVTTNPSDRRFSGAKEPFAFEGSDE